MSGYKERFKIAAYTEKWAVTMTKVRIRQAVAHAPFPRWHFVSFAGPDGGESRGVVDLIAIRKDHAERKGLKRGDTFQIILIPGQGRIRREAHSGRRDAVAGRRKTASCSRHSAGLMEERNGGEVLHLAAKTEGWRERLDRSRRYEGNFQLTRQLRQTQV
jgi:hypothetical protein